MNKSMKKYKQTVMSFVEDVLDTFSVIASVKNMLWFFSGSQIDLIISIMNNHYISPKQLIIAPLLALVVGLVLALFVSFIYELVNSLIINH